MNISLSEAFYTSLSIFEVSLRNSIHRELSEKFHTADWYKHILDFDGMREIHKEIILAQSRITRRAEIITSDKIVSELNLGFWVRLFNSEFERILWKDLRRSFPYMPKQDKKRHKISTPLNSIRNFRNRIYHYEPISWDFNELSKIHKEIYLLLHWINKDLPSLVEQLDRVPVLLNEAQIKLKKP